MARICEPCRVHSADDSLKVCPQCGGPVKFTLLPPLGEDAEPLAGVPRGMTGRYCNTPESEGCPAESPNVLSLLFSRKLGPVILGGMFVLGASFALVRGFIAVGDFDDRVAELHIGMRMDEAVAVMGGQAKPRRGDDFDMTIDTHGDGVVAWEGGSKSVTVAYRNGTVTNIEHGKAVGGMRKKITTYSR